MSRKRRAARIWDPPVIKPKKVQKKEAIKVKPVREKLPPFKLPEGTLPREYYPIKKYVHSARLDKELILKEQGLAQLIVKPVANQLPVFVIEINGFRRAKAWTLDQALKLFEKHKKEVW